MNRSRGYTSSQQKTTVYQIMHGDTLAAVLDGRGRCRICEPQFLPYSLYLEEAAEDFDLCLQNLSNFYFWCASRVLTLDRVYAKEILNSIGASQGTTDRERAQIALSYHCLSLADIFWVREEGETVTFSELNLYENSLSNAFVDVALKGRQMTIENRDLIADDLSVSGMFPKAWVRDVDGIWLLKDGEEDAVAREILASRICSCFACHQVRYERAEYEGTPVSRCRLLTSLEYGIVTREAFDIYAANQEIQSLDYILQLDGYGYDMMNVVDYLVGNTDRHWGNWGLLIRNADNRPVRLHDLMDFNRAFSAYDSLEGAGCLTTEKPGQMSQQEAAVLAVKRSGLNQTAEIREEWFVGREKDYEMFRRRYAILKQFCQK